jgi:hypothetical protein
MQAHDDIKVCIEEWDEAVLQYVADVDVAYTHELQVRSFLAKNFLRFYFGLSKGLGMRACFRGCLCGCGRSCCTHVHSPGL